MSFSLDIKINIKLSLIECIICLIMFHQLSFPTHIHPHTLKHTQTTKITERRNQF